jgi:lipocalin
MGVSICEYIIAIVHKLSLLLITFCLNRDRDNRPSDPLPGSAVIPNLDEPNRLIVTFNQSLGPIGFQTDGRYNVIDTDYETYSLVYSCSKIAYFFKSESAWILTREKVLDETKLEELKMKFPDGVVRNLKKTDQSCNFDY